MEFKSMAEKRRAEHFMKNRKVVDIFNQLCSCGHQSDEHIAGEGHCFKCGMNDKGCGKFNPIEPLTESK